MKIMMTTRKSIEKNKMKSKNSIKQRTSVFSVFEAAIINFKKIIISEKKTSKFRYLRTIGKLKIIEPKKSQIL